MRKILGLTPLVSLIIPTYNRAHLIGETLDSVIVQTFQDWECIVVDDGSEDYTLELLEFYSERDPRITFMKRPLKSQKGPNSCRNYGFERSKGKYINWLDSDDILFPEAIEKKVKSIGENDVIISQVQYVDYEGKLISLNHNYKSQKNLIEDYFTGVITYYTFTPMWSKTFLSEQRELFDEKISNLDDWDFNLRMLYEEPKICYIEEPLIYYRLHNDSLSKEIDKFNLKELKSEFRARGKHLNLLKGSRKVNYKILQLYDKNRCKKLLRIALARNQPNKLILLLMLIKRQIYLHQYQEMIRTSFGFFSIFFFGSGDRFLR